MLTEADRFFRHQLRANKAAGSAVDYLKGRGLSGKIAAQFGVGYAPPGWDNLLKASGTDPQKIKLLDVALKYSLPRLSIEKSFEEPESPREIKITVIGSDGKEKIQSTPLDENFSVKKAFGFE